MLNEHKNRKQYVRMHVYMPVELKQRLNALSEGEERLNSAHVRTAIRQYLDRWEQPTGSSE